MPTTIVDATVMTAAVCPSRDAVAALGYLVDIFDLLLFSIVRVQSLKVDTPRSGLSLIL